MRYNIPASMLLVACLSCGKSGDRLATSDQLFNYRVDSVLVDSKGHIFDLKYSLLKSDYSSEDGALYNYNGYEHSIEMIDMDRLEFSGKFPLQVEGPDGAGSRIYSLNSLGGGKLSLAGEMTGIFTIEGKLVQKIDWQKISQAHGGVAEKEYLQQQLVNPYFEQFAFALAIDHSANKVSLKKLNTIEETISSYEIDPQGNYKAYTLGDLTTYNKWDPRVFLSSQQDKLIVSHEFSNDFYVYSPASDQLQSVTYSPIHTPGKVTSTSEGDLVNSTEDRVNALQFYLEQVSFGPLVWDNQNKRYMRISSSSTFGEEKPEDRILHKTVNVDVHLSVFDEEFNLLGEIPIPELKTGSSAKYFAKDGMLWVFENMDDEVGFVRLSF